MTLCLITRALPGAHVSEAGLLAMGLKPVVVPAAKIEATNAVIDVTGVQALLMTSAAAARTTNSNQLILDLPVYAVGDATAEAAQNAGFNNVISAGGDGATLAVLAADRMSTSAGALLHLRGQEVAGDVTGMLSACGFDTRFIEVYHTSDHPDFRKGVLRYLHEGAGLILFHSPAGARRFCDAIEDQNINLSGWGAVGLSQACISPLQHRGFAHLFCASQPDENALLEAISEHFA